MKIDKYYSHPVKENGKVVGGKRIPEHVAGVKDRSQLQFYPYLNFEGIDNKHLKGFHGYVVDYHDLLKYLSFFQLYLRSIDFGNLKLKSHARGGGHIFQVFWQGREHFVGQAFLGYYLIRGHHRDLWTPHSFKADPLVDTDEILIKDHVLILQQQLKDLAMQAIIIEEETGITIPHFNELVISKQLSRLAKKFGRDRRTKELPGTSAYFLTNYLFSLLIEADKLDASHTEVYPRKRINSLAVHKKLGVPAPGNRLNELRNAVRLEVRQNMQKKDILEYSFYTLTAPTGLGKTLTSLDFALQLRERLAVERDGRQPLIVTALPFVNLIEQTLEVYQEFINDDRQQRVVGHFQFADVLRDRTVKKEDEFDSKDYGTKLMELNTWQADVVVTSFVQLTQTLISGRNKALKKFHHLAGAILILDEVQTIPLGYAPFIGSMLFYLTKYMDTKVVMMTATQPKILEYTDKMVLQDRGDSLQNVSLELLSDSEKYFKLFSRTVLKPLLEKKLETTEEFVSLFLAKRKDHEAALIVVNTVDRSIEVYKELAERFSKRGIVGNIHYLSTNVLPVDRRAKIDELKKLLKSHHQDAFNNAPILVTTQVVEAGVDLDFDIGFRDIGPIDSIVQVAGRLNREDSKDRQNSPLYVVNFGARPGAHLSDGKLVYGNPTIEKVVSVFKGKLEIAERDYYQLVAEYFTKLDNEVDEDDVLKRMQAVDELDYDQQEFGMNNFHYITDNQAVVSVIIEKGKGAEAIAALRNLKTKVFTQKEDFYAAKNNYDQLHKTHFQQHCLNVPVRYAKLLDEFELNPNLLIVPSDQVNDWYQYTSKAGADRKPSLLYGFQRSIPSLDSHAVIL